MTKEKCYADRSNCKLYNDYRRRTAWNSGRTQNSRAVKTSLTRLFGVCAMGIGISCIMKMATLPASILSLVLGLIIGELCDLENRIQSGVHKIQKPLSKILSSGNQGDPEVFMEEFISILVLFCASGTGLFGAMQSGITGDHSVLLAKAILDFFTAAIFAANLGGW